MLLSFCFVRGEKMSKIKRPPIGQKPRRASRSIHASIAWISFLSWIKTEARWLILTSAFCDHAQMESYMFTDNDLEQPKYAWISEDHWIWTWKEQETFRLDRHSATPIFCPQLFVCAMKKACTKADVCEKVAGEIAANIHEDNFGTETKAMRISVIPKMLRSLLTWAAQKNGWRISQVLFFSDIALRRNSYYG